jgi:hypothetical protein
MIAFRGREEERKVSALAELLHLDKSEVLRRAVNDLYDRYQQEFTAYEWLEPRLEELGGSGRDDVSANRKRYLDEIYGDRSRHPR